MCPDDPVPHLVRQLIDLPVATGHVPTASHALFCYPQHRRSHIAAATRHRTCSTNTATLTLIKRSATTNSWDRPPYKACGP